MGRSVDYLTGADYVLYFIADWINEKKENGDYDEFLSQLNWDNFKRNLISEICHKLKSYEECEKWDSNEVMIFLENQLCEIAISEYCGLYSLSVRAKDDEFYTSYEKVKDGLAKNHARQIRKTLEKALENAGAELLKRLGTFSNGEGVYERIKK